MHIYVDIDVCIYIYIYVCVFICTYTCIDACRAISRVQIRLRFFQHSVLGFANNI